jgi:hypothetical protein
VCDKRATIILYTYSGMGRRDRRNQTLKKERKTKNRSKKRTDEKYKFRILNIFINRNRQGKNNHF